MVGTLENVLSFPFHSTSSWRNRHAQSPVYGTHINNQMCVCVGVGIANKHILKQDLSPFSELACSQMNSIVKFPHAEFGFFRVWNWWLHMPSTWSEGNTKTPQIFGGGVSTEQDPIHGKGRHGMDPLPACWLSLYCLKMAINDFEEQWFFSVSVLKFSFCSWQPLCVASSVFCLYSPAVSLRWLCEGVF